jgi:hypothetical protein
MNIHEALEKLDSLQAQIIHGGRPFGDIADAIRADRAEKLKSLENCLNWTWRAIDLEVSGTMQMVATQHAREAKAILDSENDQAMVTNPAPKTPK